MNWSAIVIISLLPFITVIIVLFVHLNHRNNQYYNIIHGDLLSLVPLKIDLKNEIITFSDRLEVLNRKKRISLFVFKAMINRKTKVEIEIFIQDLLVNKIPFEPCHFSVSFQLHNKIIIYDLSVHYFDNSSKILYGQMQSNIRYNRFAISQAIVLQQSELTVVKASFVQSVLDNFSQKKYSKKSTSQFEYMILIKIKNYLALENILTVNNIERMELLISYYSKITLGLDNSIICRYYDGQFLIYSRNKRINLYRFQKQLNAYIKRNLVEKSSYLQIQTQVLCIYANAKSESSNVYILYNQIIDKNQLETVQKNDLIEIKLRSNDINNFPDFNHYSVLQSEQMEKMLNVSIRPVFKSDNSNEPNCYYAWWNLVKNSYYDSYLVLMRNIQDSGLWWKVSEPLFIESLEKFVKLKQNKNLIIPISLVELQDKTILTKIISIVNKRKSLFENCDLIFDFQDIGEINSWNKYDPIIKAIRSNKIKISFTHDLLHIDNFKLINHFKPDYVVLTSNLLEQVTFSFSKYIDVIICIHYLNILGIKNILARGLINVPEIIVLKSLKVDYLLGKILESEQANKALDALNYPNYWKWHKSQSMKGE
ncbi:hypothetical protein [Spiroplasma endosymbiont of Virgichneumon dumeticola]|uniref:hypothetical protein n=1 Tax=Spiroplasma endosymbiont of Virgichneumon dumeticola TaxID=3139323 RepID=UPI0035C93524